jgi:hypothetical protein
MHTPFAKEQSPPSAEIGIRQFQPGDAAAFRRLNEEWITRFFRIEPAEQPILAIRRQLFWTWAGEFFSQPLMNDALVAAP